MPTEEKKWQRYAGPKKASMKRRCDEHDYRERGIYMITLAIEGRRPLLGTLRGDPAATEGGERPQVELSPLGEKVKECWLSIARYHPEIEVMKLCIMPDHIHGILFVHERMEKHLGQVIKGFKAGTHQALRALEESTDAATLLQPTRPPKETTPAAQGSLTTSPVNEAPAPPVRYAATPLQPSPYTAEARAHGLLWETGYHDRLLLHKGQLQRMLAYLDDNPRRLLLKRLHPEFFTNLGTLTVAGTAMQAMGNRHLLDNPAKLQVQCSRHLYQNEIDERRDFFLDEGRAGAVLVSPCISPGESQIATAALEAGIPLIVLLLKGFHPHFKPQPRYLAACTAGRLLMLAPFPWQNEKIEHLRSRCLQLNSLAAQLCNTD